MKTIKLINGEIRHGYEFDDFTPELQDKIINDHINFEIIVMDENSPYYDLAEEMEKMQTPWFLGQAIYDGYKNNIIETIKANDYLFDDEGVILPVTYHYEKDKLIRTTFGKKEIECTIE